MPLPLHGKYVILGSTVRDNKGCSVLILDKPEILTSDTLPLPKPKNHVPIPPKKHTNTLAPTLISPLSQHLVYGQMSYISYFNFDSGFGFHIISKLQRFPDIIQNEGFRGHRP